MTQQAERLPRSWIVSACVVIIIVTIVFTWPLAAHLSSDIIGPLRADNLEYVWKMWWVPHAILQGDNPFFNPNMAVPAGYPLAYGELTPIHTFLYAPLTVLMGEVTAYNLSILASFLLTGWLTFGLGLRLLARLEVSRDRRFMGALLASLTYAFCAYRMARVTVHLPLVDTHWLVLAFWALDVWLEGRHVRAALVLGAATALAGLSSWYYLFMLGLLMPVYAIAHLHSRLGGLIRDRKAWGGIVAGGAVFATLVIPFLLPYLEISREGTAVIPLEDVAFWSASFADYLLPNPRHPLWGQAVQSLVWPFPGNGLPYEFIFSVGWTTLVLMIAGWQKAHGPSFRAWKWTIAAAVILSFGPFLNFGRFVTSIPLPALLLRELIPFAEGVRAWGRFSVVAMLGFGLLSGAGLTILLGKVPDRARWAIATGVCAAVLFGAWPGSAQLVTVGPRNVDEWLAGQTDNAPIMEFPLNMALSGSAVLGTRYHGKPVVFGYGTYFPYLFREQNPELLAFPEDAALDRLAEWGVRYIVVHTIALDSENFSLDDVLAQPRLRLVQEYEDAIIVELAE